MAARTKARKRALDLLFEAEQRGVNAADLLRERLAAPVTEAPLSEFTADLVMGVVEHWGQVDELIETYSQGWTLGRMPAVDRAILRLGAYEVIWSTDVPEPVAISEWVGPGDRAVHRRQPALRQRAARPPRRGQADPGLSVAGTGQPASARVEPTPRQVSPPGTSGCFSS